MKLKNTLILLLIAGAIFAFIYFFEQKQPTTREAQDRASRVVQLDRDEINAIMIKNAETKIELRKQENSQWMLQEPVKDRADSMAVAQLFTSAESLKHDAVIGEEGKGAGKGDIKEFGLSNSEVKVKFSGGKKDTELLFGKDAAVEGKVYVRLADSNTVYVIPNDLRNQISKKVDEFRDRKLTELAATQVNKLSIQSKAGEIEAEKKDGRWTLLKPLQARGDDSKVGDLISQATNARIESFSDSSNPAAQGLQEPRGTITLHGEGQDKPTVLQIGGNPAEEKDKEKTYVKLSTREGVVLLPKAIEQLLETKPNDLRDRRLVQVEADIVDRITIQAPGREKLVLARSGEGWVRKGEKDEPVNATQATRLITDLQSQQVMDFEADVATDLPKYGLDQPQVSVTLSSYASENTAETQAGEKPIVTVHFGKVENGQVFAKLDNEPFVVTVGSQILETTAVDPLQWQQLGIFSGKGADVSSVEVTRTGQPTLAFERDKEKKENWKLAKGDGAVNPVNVESLVNTLAALQAVRWIGPVAPEHGFDKPSAVLTFSGANNLGGKLTVGGSTPEEMWYATAEGRTGTFLISRPDMEAFRLPLLEKAAGANAASEAAPPPDAPTTPEPVPADAAPDVPPAAAPAPIPAPAPDAAPAVQPEVPAAPEVPTAETLAPPPAAPEEAPETGTPPSP
jgi:hypothetical protein